MLALDKVWPEFVRMELSMSDIIFLATGVAVFVVFAAYVAGLRKI